MVLTGRAALLALVGAGVVGLLVAGGVIPWQALVVVNAVLLLVLVVDAVRAPTPRAWRWSAAGTARCASARSRTSSWP